MMPNTDREESIPSLQPTRTHEVPGHARPSLSLTRALARRVLKCPARSLNWVVRRQTAQLAMPSFPRV